MTSTMKSKDFVKLAKDNFINFFYNSMIYSIVKLGNRCAQKPPKRHSQDFFHAVCFRRCPMARTALKHKHMASKFYLGVKQWKNHSTMITFSKSYLLHISFHLLCSNFSGCSRITKCAQ